MKKMLLYFSVLALCASCDPPQKCYGWWIKNSTDKTLIFKYFDCMHYQQIYHNSSLSPGDSVMLYGLCFEDNKRIHFNSYFEKSVGLEGADVYWQILSENDVVLKTWNYSDYGLPNQRFFDESSWQYHVEAGYGRISSEPTWTFEILPEDITSD